MYHSFTTVHGVKYIKKYYIRKNSAHIILDLVVYGNLTSLPLFIRHINPLMFDVIDDELGGVAQGVYHV